MSSVKEAAKPHEAKHLPVEARSNLPAEVESGKSVAQYDGGDMFESRAGQGLEKVTAKDLLIPRVTILQALSPQCQRTKPEYNPDCKPGMIYDTGLQEMFEGPITYVPVFFIVQYLEWRPGRKGLAGIHEGPSILQDARPNERRQPVLPNGNIIQETAQFFGLNITADGRRSFIAMASTQLKKGRRWNTLATSEKLRRKDGSEYTPPLFYRSYTLSTVGESNEEGSWEGWKIERGAPITFLNDPSIDLRDQPGDDMTKSPHAPYRRRIFNEAADFYDSIVAGRSKADLDSIAPEEGSADKDRM